MRSEFGPAQHRALANTRQTRVLCNHASDMSCDTNGTSMSGIMLTWGKWVPTYSTQIDVFRLMEVPFSCDTFTSSYGLLQYELADVHSPSLTYLYLRLAQTYPPSRYPLVPSSS